MPTCESNVFSFFVSTEQGKVLKVLHTSEGVFIISQYSLFHNKGPVLNMAIDSHKVLITLQLFMVQVKGLYSEEKKENLGNTGAGGGCEISPGNRSESQGTSWNHESKEKRETEARWDKQEPEQTGKDVTKLRSIYIETAGEWTQVKLIRAGQAIKSCRGEGAGWDAQGQSLQNKTEIIGNVRLNRSHPFI